MRVGKISGFDVRIHWTTLVIFTLLVLSLTSVQLPEAAPGYSEGAYLIAALLTGVVFYLSLLAHEVSHAVMARREGIEVRSLTLWMLGGLAELAGEPRDARGDLRVAGIGPVVSLLLAIGFGVAAAGLAAAGAPSLLWATFAWLAGINAILALFNLVPAAPLDGGRILRAILWRIRGDRTAAAVAATRAGEVFGYVLIGLGLARLFFGTGLGGIWFIVLGWFVLNAARAEQAQTLVHDALRDVRVADVMTRDPMTAPDYVTVAHLLEDYVLRTRHSAFPLVGFDGRPSGLVTLSQIRTVPPAERRVRQARDIACRLGDICTTTADERLLDLVPRMRGCCGGGRALVLDGDRLVGIVTSTDVTRALELATLDGPVVDLRAGDGFPLSTTLDR